MIGGQQGNSLLELIKQGKLHKKAPPSKKDDKATIGSRPVSAGPTTEVCCIDLKSASLCMLPLSLLGMLCPSYSSTTEVCCLIRHQDLKYTVAWSNMEVLWEVLLRTPSVPLPLMSLRQCKGGVVMCAL